MLDQLKRAEFEARRTRLRVDVPSDFVILSSGLLDTIGV
jgi:hypothetical protein